MKKENKNIQLINRLEYLANYILKDINENIDDINEIDENQLEKLVDELDHLENKIYWCFTNNLDDDD